MLSEAWSKLSESEHGRHIVTVHVTVQHKTLLVGKSQDNQFNFQYPNCWEIHKESYASRKLEVDNAYIYMYRLNYPLYRDPMT